MASSDVSKADCALDLAESTGDLNLLQASVRAITNDKEAHSALKVGVQESPVVGKETELGNEACRCIGVAAKGRVPIEVENQTVTYPAHFGTQCQAWDIKRYPGCDAEKPPDFCSKKWCYVDPCKCRIAPAPKRSSLNFSYQGAPLYWSYATCGDEDLLSHIAPGVCPNQKIESDCKANDGCAWDGSRCLSQELSDACNTSVQASEEVTGKKTCRCIGRTYMGGTVKMDFGSDRMTYPASVGGNCSAWDDGNYKDCKGDDAPAWCKQKWCYVDPCDCDLPDSQPKKTTAKVKFQGNPAYWSYATCGGQDLFTEENRTLPKFPPAFCPAPPVDLGADHCQCIGINAPGEIFVSMGENVSATYPAKVGSSCDSWDVGNDPDCKGENPPDWCLAKWCYVNPCTCHLNSPPRRTITNLTWQGKAAFWSYETCASTDKHSGHDQKACVNKQGPRLCELTDGCAFDKKKNLCMGKELVEDCQHMDKNSKDVFGNKQCRCIGFSSDGYYNLTKGNQSRTYPSSMGSNCSAWDDSFDPNCKTDNPPDWCKKKWCYVDPCSCGLLDSNPKETAWGLLYKNKPAYWSYATCNEKDIYTGDASKRPTFPPEFCASLVSEDSEEVSELASLEAKSKAMGYKLLSCMMILVLAMLSQF